jgi:hypothetical protein
VVGRAPTLLTLVAGLALYDTFHASLWNASSDWWDVAFLAFVLIPASFAVVWLLLPLRRAPGLLPVAIALGVLTWAFHVAGWNTPENLTKLFAITFAGFWFLHYFETAAWVVVVALIIPWVDAYSVWRGPTKVIVTQHPDVFTSLSYALPIPGVDAGANLGVPDVLFFALFLAAAARFGLRRGLTWWALTASLGITITITVWAQRAGLPALPGLALGFLVPNADLLWKRVRQEGWSLQAPTSDAGQRQP